MVDTCDSLRSVETCDTDSLWSTLVTVCGLWRLVTVCDNTVTHIHTHTHAHTYTCTHTHTHAHTCSYACTHAHTHTHTHTHTHIHTHTHTYTHTRTHAHDPVKRNVNCLLPAAPQDSDTDWCDREVGHQVSVTPFPSVGQCVALSHYQNRVRCLGPLM